MMSEIFARVSKMGVALIVCIPKKYHSDFAQNDFVSIRKIDPMEANNV